MKNLQKYHQEELDSIKKDFIEKEKILQQSQKDYTYMINIQKEKTK